jgi:membrane complex biogenesis BtpA family protein
MELRRFGSGDEDVVRALATQGEPARVGELLADDRTLFVVALEHGVAIGFAFGYELIRRHGEASQLFVYELQIDPEHRRRGVATALMSELGGLARRRGIRSGFLLTNESNAPAMALSPRSAGIDRTPTTCSGTSCLTSRVPGFADLFPDKPLIGMIHLPALPSAPRNELDVDRLIEFALDEAGKLERAGLDGAIVENVGDVPLFKDDVPPVTVAAMARIVAAVVDGSRLHVGVNVLRNACEAALAVAHVAGARFIRCNVVIGAYVTDQGIIEGCAAPLARLRRSLGSEVLVLGDVHVKHAYPLFNVPIEDAARDLAERGGAEAVIVSGARSPDPPTLERVAAVREAVEAPVLIGSGLGVANAKEYYDASDGILLGEVDFKLDRVWGGASDEAAYAGAVEACRG